MPQPMTLPGRTNVRRFTLALVSAALAIACSPASAAERYWPPITDPPTGEYRPGKFVWAELLTRDVARAADFYAKVFGWTYQTFGPEDDLQTYTLVFANGAPIGGLVFANTNEPQTLPDARWVGLMSVTDVAAAASAAGNHGGRVLLRPLKAGVRGELALLADPEGALVGVLRSATGDPADYLPEVGEWLWFELWADDPEAMSQFYQRLANFRIASGATTAAGDRGVHLVAGELPRAGILAKPAPVPTTWIPYVRVASVAETVRKARSAGGSIVIEPMAARGTLVALMLDPTGAPVAVAEWREREGQ